MRLNPDSLSLIVGEEYALSPEGNISITGDIIWSTSNNLVATVDQEGHVKAVASGKAVISAQVSGCAAFCDIVVCNEVPDVESIRFGEDDYKLAVGIGEQLVVEVSPVSQDVPLVWSVEDPSVASVDAEGFVLGLAEGNTKVMVQAGQVSAECNLTVCKLAGIGDYYYSDGTYSYDLDKTKEAIGIVFLVNSDGCSGKIMSLDEEYTTWGPTDVTTYAREELNGLVNMATLQSLQGWPDDFPAASKCADRVTGGLDWYLPATMELRQIYAAAFGRRWVLSGADESKGEVNDWGTGHAFDGFDDENNLKKREEFNARITAVDGAAPFGKEEWHYDYWSSTEQDYGLIYCINCDTGLVSISFSSNKYNRIRPVAIF